MIVKIIKSYRDTDLESALIPSSRNNTEVLVNVPDERGKQLIKAGVGEEYTVVDSKEEINVLEAEPRIEVEEVKTEETTDVVDSKEEKKNNSKKNNK